MRKNDNINYNRPLLTCSYSVRHGHGPQATYSLPRKRRHLPVRKAFLCRLADRIMDRYPYKGTGWGRYEAATKILNSDRRPSGV